jgi:hypothetical protein
MVACKSTAFLSTRHRAKRLYGCASRRGPGSTPSSTALSKFSQTALILCSVPRLMLRAWNPARRSAPNRMTTVARLWFGRGTSNVARQCDPAPSLRVVLDLNLCPFDRVSVNCRWSQATDRRGSPPLHSPWPRKHPPVNRRGGVSCEPRRSSGQDSTDD